MYSDDNTRAIPSNIGCCFLIKHSETCRQLKEGTLLLIQGVALVAIAGSIVAILAINGLNLGGINTITALIAEKWVYITLVTGASLLAINTVLIAALTRSYYNKQYTQREIDNLGLGDWVEQEDILSKLEPGQYWKLPADLEQPERGDQGRPAIFGALVRDFNDNIGVYAFRTEEDRMALIYQLGYRNGKSAFRDSEAYPERFIQPKMSDQHRIDISEANDVRLSNGEYLKVDLNQLEIDRQFKDVYVLRVKKDGVDSLTYFKTRASRQAAQSGLLNHATIERVIRRLPDLPYLPEGSFWEVQDPIEVTPYGEDQTEKQLYLLFVKEQGETVPESLYFSSEEERADFVILAVQRDHLIDAQKAWNDETYFPNDWVEARIDLNELNNTPLRALECAYKNFEAQGKAIFALRFEDPAREAQNLYFKTEEARNDYINILLIEGYRDIQMINQIAGQLIIDNYLNKILETDDVDCWLGNGMAGRFCFSLILRKTVGGIKAEIFPTELELREFLQAHPRLKPVNNEQGRYLPGGEYKPGWVSQVSALQSIETATRAALENNQFASGQFQTNTQKDIFWLTSQNSEGLRETHYFISNDAVNIYIQNYLVGLVNLNEPDAVAKSFRDKHLLNLALANDNDFWGEANVAVGDQSMNILFKRSGGNIEISYPEVLPNDESEHNIKHMIKVRGEYPSALGSHFISLDGAKNSSIFKGEYLAWQDINTTTAAYPKVSAATIRNDDGQIINRFFTTDEARARALDGLTNRLSREQNEQNKAIEISKTVNAYLDVKVDHCVVFENDDKKHCVFVSKEGVLGVTFENEAAPRKSTYDGHTKGLTDPTAYYHNLAPERIGAKAQEILKTNLLRFALSNVGDCWGEENVKIEDLKKNILFINRGGAEGITISYPDDLENAMDGLRDIKKMIEHDGEFPTALGAHLREDDKDWLEKREARTFNGEYRSFILTKSTKSTQYPHCFVAHFKDNNILTTRYFTTEESRRIAIGDRQSSYSRELLEKKIAIRKSIAVNETLGVNAVDHCVVIDYGEDKGKLCIYIPRDGNFDNTETEFFTGNQAVNTQGKADPSEAYNELPNISDNESDYINQKETTSILKTYIGQGGKLTNGNYYEFEKNGIFGLLWAVEKTDNENRKILEGHWQYFKSAELRSQHIEANLQGFNPFVE